MTRHATLDSKEMVDRLAIRQLVDAYAYCADRRDAKGQLALFTPDTHFVVYMDARLGGGGGSRTRVRNPCQ
jgi:hypothetical protein